LSEYVRAAFKEFHPIHYESFLKSTKRNGVWIPRALEDLRAGRRDYFTIAKLRAHVAITHDGFQARHLLENTRIVHILAYGLIEHLEFKAGGVR
jgi:hypothetical protein